MSTAGFHITEDCAEVYLQNEFGMEFLQLAKQFHDYLRQEQPFRRVAGLPFAAPLPASNRAWRCSAGEHGAFLLQM